ncbi:helix-turn-helix transcriptional regulator [Actinocorallia longicatena]|uniref:HTH luxR-type domain-containing protein n=1 Tax=Actinocorallia longicatena TaxID=111803 RepID=A0ABP6QCV7_9ACTN
MAADAFAGRVRPPRPLPEGEPLSPEDYRRLFGVIESVDRAIDLPMFRECLLRALQSWFGYTGVAVLHGDTLADAVAGGCGVQGGYSAEFLEEYEAAGWAAADPFRTERGQEALLAAGVVTMTDLEPSQDYLDRFLRPHGITDKAALVIDAGPAGVLYVGIAVRDMPRVPERDLAALRALRRHLTPLVADQLERHRERTAARSSWRLTPREWEVADLAAQGLTNRQIADRLFIGVDTVKKHLTRALAETGAPTRTRLALLWQPR